MPKSGEIVYRDEPVTLTPEQVQASQGTRLDTENPWDSYGDEMKVQTTPELEAAIEEYSRHVYEKSSNQTKEELARQQEMSYDAADEYRWCTKEEYADIEARMGKIIHSSELINRLRNELKLKCWYREHPHKDKLTLMVLRDKNGAEPEVACWVKNGWMPEYTVMGFDDRGVPLAEKYRGWRTAILQLILKQFTTEEKAHQVFGAADRCCAGKYNSILYGIRNTREE
jgi:hypothetical protein